MKKIERYELMYIKCIWAFILIGLVCIAGYHVVSGAYAAFHMKIWMDISFFALVGLVNYIKLLLLGKGVYNNNIIYNIGRCSELLILSFCLVFIGAGQWAYVLIVFPILITSLCKGSRLGLIFLAYAFIIHALMMIYREISVAKQTSGVLISLVSENFFNLSLYYAVVVFFTVLCGMIYKDSSESNRYKEELVKQLEEKYGQLETAQEEIKFHYEKVKKTNAMLEEANKKLTVSIAEFYTLQQISQAISSILDVKELLKNVNDIIIGVMGVSTSTIILFDTSVKKLRVHTTNITNPDELEVVESSINCPELHDVLKNSKPIIENLVNPKEYTFTRDREVNSFICIPLSTKSRKFGLVLVEQKHSSAFDEESLRLLEIIGQQVGIAMENAELYQQMQTMATTDGLTQVYNRVHFQEMLQQEVDKASKESTRLSLAIFDIDHFKRFNDTFGHLFGDKVLKNIAETIKSSVKDRGIVARYGGEEFIILFPDMGIDEAYEKIESCRSEIAKRFVTDGEVTASVTASFGISCYPDSAASQGELLRTADEALYDAKASGRNCVRVANVHYVKA